MSIIEFEKGFVYEGTYTGDGKIVYMLCVNRTRNKVTFQPCTSEKKPAQAKKATYPIDPLDSNYNGYERVIDYSVYPPFEIKASMIADILDEVA